MVDMDATHAGPEPGRPRLSRRVILLGGASIVSAAAIGTTVALTRDPETVTAGANLGLDRTDAGASAFFGRFALGGAVEVERYGSVPEMSRAATAVVVAKVVDVVATRTIVGEGSDRVGMIGLVLEPEVVKGAVGPRFADRLVVEFVGGSEPVEKTVAEMRAEIPEAKAVWFLRAKSEGADRRLKELRARGRAPSPREAEVIETDRRYFRLVSSQGFFVQGRDGVENPMRPAETGEVDPLQSRTKRIAKLSKLVGEVKAAG